MGLGFPIWEMHRLDWKLVAAFPSLTFNDSSYMWVTLGSKIKEGNWGGL